MVKFFCLTNKTKDVTIAAAIVSTIAKKVGAKQTLLVKAIPPFVSQYPAVIFEANIPKILSSYRRNIHEDVIDVGEDVFINVWLHQLRDHFMKSGTPSAMLEVSKNCMVAMGLRKRISMKHILECPLDPDLKKITPSNRDALVCVTNDAYNDIDEDFLNLITSSLSRFDFIIQTPSKFKSANCYSCPAVDEFAGYMKGCDVVITTSQYTLLPFFHAAKGKKVFLMVPDDIEVVNHAKMFESTDNSITSLIRELRTIPTKSI
jgi:hypothetical protein